jgi:hypothetical protein
VRYLYSTRFLAIIYDGSITNALVIATDASFDDNPHTKKSLHGYIITIYKGPIMWRSGLQNGINTSTTEAELKELAATVKKSLALERFLRDIEVIFILPFKMYYNNQQTIRLMVNENRRLNTKLRHIDINNMWLKQMYRNSRFLVEYLPTADMPADGFTKSLPRQQFQHFRSLLNLRDMRHALGLAENTTCELPV